MTSVGYVLYHCGNLTEMHTSSSAYCTIQTFTKATNKVDIIVLSVVNSRNTSLSRPRSVSMSEITFLHSNKV